ncbi:uncharacterized protein [Amphiura filiformis]|uniref:uncharacterized protein n=1 Tax=Amphiura filiformis TaxID=82378 RepID=UPI003B217A77
MFDNRRCVLLQCGFLFTVLTVLILCNNVKTINASVVDSVKETWDDFTKSDMVRKAQKSWKRAGEKSQSFFGKVANGQLSDDIAQYIDNTLYKLFNVRVGDLSKKGKEIDSTTLAGFLLVVWFIFGYLSYHMMSLGSCLFVMSITLVLHALYGPIWCLTQLVVLIGLCMYLCSLVANNIVIASMTIITIYIGYRVFGLFRRSMRATVADVDEKLLHLHYRQNLVEDKLDKIDDKIDKLLNDRE